MIRLERNRSSKEVGHQHSSLKIPRLHVLNKILSCVARGSYKLDETIHAAVSMQTIFRSNDEKSDVQCVK